MELEYVFKLVFSVSSVLIFQCHEPSSTLMWMWVYSTPPFPRQILNSMEDKWHPILKSQVNNSPFMVSISLSYTCISFREIIFYNKKHNLLNSLVEQCDENLVFEQIAIYFMPCNVLNVYRLIFWIIDMNLLDRGNALIPMIGSN